MDYTVQLVSSQDCHVALPQSLIQLLSTAADFPPVPLYLELRTSGRSNASLTPQPRQVWHLAWMGLTASGPDLEVSQALGECIGLPAGSSVRIKVRRAEDIPVGTSIELEPASSDDWEALELNQTYLEEQILTQLAVISKGQQFPVWIRRQAYITLRVTSTSPKSVVRLTNGTELLVAPKDRISLKGKPKTVLGENGGSLESGLEGDIPTFWLRVQDCGAESEADGECSPGPVISWPACVGYLSPGTAAKCHLAEGEWVTVTVPPTRSSTEVKGMQPAREASPNESRGYSKDSGGGDEDRERRGRQVTSVQIRISDNVVGNHIGLPPRTRYGCGARTLTLVRVQSLRAMTSAAPVPLPKVVSLSPMALANSSPIGFSSSRRGKGSKKGGGQWERHREVLALAGKAWARSGEGDEGIDNEDYGEGKEVSGKAFLLGVSVAEESPIVGQTVIGCRRREVGNEKGKFGAHTGEMGPQDVSEIRVGDGHEEDSVLLFLLSLNEPPSLKGGSANPHPVKGGVVTWGRLREGLVSGQVSAQLAGPSLCQLEEVDRWQNVVPLSSLSWLRAPAESAMTHLRTTLSHQAVETRKVLGTPPPGGVLLSGAQASGKSQLALAIARELRDDATCLAYPVYIRCGDLVGEAAKVVRQVLTDGIGEAGDKAPAVVVLDDVDALMPAGKGEGEMESPMVEFLGDFLDSCQREGAPPVAFLALARSPNLVAPQLQISGRLEFSVELPAPAESERASILSQLLEDRHLSCPPGLVASVAARCQGYDASDMEVLVDRAVHAASARYLRAGQVAAPRRAQEGEGSGGRGRGRGGGRRVGGGVEVEEADFKRGEDGFVPAAMRGLAKPPPSGDQKKRGWGDVGGLAGVQAALREVLELPAQHSKIFAAAPLRLRSGVLLYGPPGCGKTHIVASAASACGLRLISVKGPELLNKYIGASEQGVRDVFARAQVAAPCILFFDEFDAIAPQRGHDNTGVTDRVVNQLLTELDGVEGLTGVFVIAATSRPDLIDAALLRPGRLDRLLFCDFPDRGERVQILGALAGDLPLGEGVDLEEVAEQMAGCSGADLQAVLGEAQVAAVHGVLEEGGGTGGGWGEEECAYNEGTAGGSRRLC